MQKLIVEFVREAVTHGLNFSRTLVRVGAFRISVNVSVARDDAR